MIYTWQCMECGEKVEVSRPLAEYMRAPEGVEAVHDGCDSTTFKKLVTMPSRIQINENEAYYA